jgi:translation initiation factor IF-3
LKAFVFFKGRSIIYKDQGQILLRLATDLEEFGKVDASSRRKENDYVHCPKKKERVLSR